MLKYILIPLLPFLFLNTAFAQQRDVYGSVTDSTGATIPGARVKLISPRDSTVVATGANGQFVFTGVVSKNFKLTITSLGYQDFVRRYVMDNDTKPIKLDPVKLKAQSNMLKTVNIVDVNPISVREDTVEYKASAYKVREGSMVEELLKKLPGVSVDKDGNVTAHGKQVTKVRVDGKDYFTGDVQTATQNLPADIVENIQVIDDYGDMANLTGIKTGDPDKILNITIQKGKRHGKFGQAAVGAGNDGRYLARMSANSFNDNQQVAMIGTVNNNNTNAFNLAPAGGSGGRSGRGGGGGGSSSGVSTASGITDNRSVGFNYRDDWGKKVTVYGSYSFADRDKTTTSVTQQQNLFQSGSLINNDNSNDVNHSINHRFSFNIEYKIDTLNYLKITPNYSYGSTNDNSTDIFNNTRNGVVVNGHELSMTNSAAPSGGATLLFNHKFHKKGRNFDINASYSYSKNTQALNDQYTTVQDSVITPLYQQINTASSSDRLSVRLSYIEPIGKTTYLEGNYNYSYSNTDNNRFNYRIDPVTAAQTYVDSLSTLYNYQFITNRFGLNLRGIKPKYNYTVGLSAQPSLLEGQSHGFHISTSTFNFVPTARFVYNFARNHTFTINYSGNSGQPSFAELQVQPDNSNPQNKVYGNPDLKPSFSNTVYVRYNVFDIKSGNSLFTNVSFNTVQDQIVTSTSPVDNSASTDAAAKGIVQETHYLNTNGFYSATGNYSFSKPFENRKYTVTLNGGANFNNNISYIEDQRNVGKNWVFNQGAKLRVDLDSVMDSEISANYSINNTTYSLPSSINTNARTWTLGLNGRNYFWYNLILGYDLAQTINNGFSSTVKANPTLLSTYVEYQFLKKHAASLRFQAYDLFNQNTGITRSVSGSQIIDTRTNRLGRYFMLSFVLRLQKFAGGSGPRGGRGGRGGGGRGFGGGGRRGG